MSHNIQFKRGLKENLPTSAPVGTPLWCTDTQELYIGTGDGVVLIKGESSSSSESYSKEEIDTMLGDIESLLQEV